MAFKFNSLTLLLLTFCLFQNCQGHRILMNEVSSIGDGPATSSTQFTSSSLKDGNSFEKIEVDANDQDENNEWQEKQQNNSRILQDYKIPDNNDQQDGTAQIDDIIIDDEMTIIPIYIDILQDLEDDNNQYDHSTQNQTADQMIDQTIDQEIDQNAPAWLNFNKYEHETFLTDKYNYFVTTKGNRVWAGALSLMWDQMKRSLLNGQNSSFYNQLNPIQEKLIENLNDGQFSKKDLSENSYYVMSGFGQETVDKINLEVNEKFPNRTFEDIDANLQPDDFIAYTYIYKHLEFLTPFQETRDFRFNGVSTSGFEARTAKQKRQLYYKYYNGDNDFLMGIESKNSNEELLLLSSPHRQVNKFSFYKIIKMLEFYDSQPNQKLGINDKFAMPNLEFDYTRILNQMKGLTFTHPNAKNCSISEIKQRLKLKITKEGVVMENEASMIITSTWDPEMKFFVLDRNFWVIMKEKNKAPYLLMLVRNVEEQWTN